MIREWMLNRGPIQRPKTGKTLLELLITIGILAFLLQLLLPAVQAARELARQRQCGFHLRELGLATNLHRDAFGYFPSGGWHYTWIGEPERGAGARQPGGWPFSLLAFIDQSGLRDLGRDLSGEQRSQALISRCRTVLPTFHCPSRRTAQPYPQTWNRLPWTRDGQLSQPLDWVAKTDYAANVGVALQVEYDSAWQGPQSLADADASDFLWPENRMFNGIIFGRSQIRPRQIRDGLSRTYLLAEKYLDPLHYTTGEDWGDNENLYSGFNNDHTRSALTPPQRDQSGKDYRNSFGSAHPSIWQAVLCDGSLRTLRFDLDLSLHQTFSHRSDGR